MQTARNLLVAQALPHQQRHLAFARGELAQHRQLPLLRLGAGGARRRVVDQLGEQIRTREQRIVHHHEVEIGAQTGLIRVRELPPQSTLRSARGERLRVVLREQFFVGLQKNRRDRKDRATVHPARNHRTEVPPRAGLEGLGVGEDEFAFRVHQEDALGQEIDKLLERAAADAFFFLLLDPTEIAVKNRVEIEQQVHLATGELGVGERPTQNQNTFALTAFPSRQADEFVETLGAEHVAVKIRAPPRAQVGRQHLLQVVEFDAGVIVEVGVGGRELGAGPPPGDGPQRRLRVERERTGNLLLRIEKERRRVMVGQRRADEAAQCRPKLRDVGGGLETDHRALQRRIIDPQGAVADLDGGGFLGGRQSAREPNPFPRRAHGEKRDLARGGATRFLHRARAGFGLEVGRVRSRPVCSP